MERVRHLFATLQSRTFSHIIAVSQSQELDCVQELWLYPISQVKEQVGYGLLTFSSRKRGGGVEATFYLILRPLDTFNNYTKGNRGRYSCLLQ